MEQKKAPAYAAILAAAALWGIIGLWNRNLMAAGLSPTSIVVVRNFGGMVLLALVFAFRDRSVFRVERKHLKYFFGTGVVSVVTGRKIAALGLTLVGCALVCGVFSGALTVTLWGILLGLGAGFFYALYSVFGRYALAHYNSITVTVWTFLFAGPASLVLLRPAELAEAFSLGETWVLAMGLVVFSTVTPYILYTLGLSHVESGKASILASLEPVVASLLGVWVFQEPVGPQTWLGVACVLAGVVILR